ncbi:MAG: hypothetical protein GXO77_07375 [Calditrichaeota bacterium]|nr:hypothetical protein [Calditrichota bacterium]
MNSGMKIITPMSGQAVLGGTKSSFSVMEQELFEERAAIMEYEAGFPRKKAEQLARREILERRKLQELLKAG